jgi:hypothetical protein
VSESNFFVFESKKYVKYRIQLGTHLSPSPCMQERAAAHFIFAFYMYVPIHTYLLFVAIITISMSFHKSQQIG